MTKRNGLPRRVYIKHGRYWYVRPIDAKWLPLTRVDQGLPAMLRALATLVDGEIAVDLVPAVATRWVDDRAADGAWSPGTRTDIDRVVARISARMRTLRPDQVSAKLAAEYLREYLDRPRTYNQHRNVLGQILSYAATQGLRDGHNPVADIPQRRTEPRARIVTDAEVAALKAAALQQTRNGAALARMIDLALLTGQRIGDVIGLRWQDVSAEGITVVQGKGKGRVRLLIEMTPALQTALDACAEGTHRIGHVLKTQTGSGYTYAGIRSAWVRACARAGITNLHIHDLRGRAGVDAIQATPDQDIRAAQRLLGHSGEAMTRHYTEGKYAKRVRPPR